VECKNPYAVYILECSDGTLYTGIAKDVVKRIEIHNAGRGAKYTRARLPVRLIFVALGFTRSSALKSEYEVKQLSRAEKEMLCTLSDE
jgi:putative endonuclease